jgi:hypothetical protein
MYNYILGGVNMTTNNKSVFDIGAVHLFDNRLIVILSETDNFYGVTVLDKNIN